MKAKTLYTTYVVKNSETVEVTHWVGKLAAESDYRSLANQYSVSDGYEVCLYVGIEDAPDMEMIANTWLANESAA